MNSEEIIKSWRWRAAKAGLNQKSLAHLLGVSNVSISNYINGKTEPTLTNFEKIENYLKSLGV